MDDFVLLGDDANALRSACWLSGRPSVAAAVLRVEHLDVEVDLDPADGEFGDVAEQPRPVQPVAPGSGWKMLMRPGTGSRPPPPMAWTPGTSRTTRRPSTISSKMR